MTPFASPRLVESTDVTMLRTSSLHSTGGSLRAQRHIGSKPCCKSTLSLSPMSEFKISTIHVYGGIIIRGLRGCAQYTTSCWNAGLFPRRDPTWHLLYKNGNNKNLLWPINVLSFVTFTEQGISIRSPWNGTRDSCYPSLGLECGFCACAGTTIPGQSSRMNKNIGNIFWVGFIIIIITITIITTINITTFLLLKLRWLIDNRKTSNTSRLEF